MKLKILLAVFILNNGLTFGQQNCDCETAMANLITKIENAYPGFEDKTSDALRYEHFKSMVKKKAQNTSRPECLELLRSYLSYFNDRHIYLSSAGQSQVDQEEEKFYLKADITPEDFNKLLSHTSDSIEGIWKSPAYKVGIVKRNDEYHAFIIDADTSYWKPYEIKFKLLKDGSVNYYMRDHSLFEETWNIYDGCILYFNKLQTAFVKVEPTPILTTLEIKKKVNEIEGFYFKQITDQTALLKISGFMYSDVDRIEKLIADNANLIKNSENLIIDIRNNGGGTDDAYRMILPYICTNSLRLVGAQFLATNGLINGLQNWMEKLPDEEKYDADRARIKNKIALYRKNLGEFVGSGSKPVYVDTINPADQSPARVVILANKGTGSAAESFLYKAKQSKKVKVMGTPTGGVLDYGSARSFNFGCDAYNLSLPTFRSLRLPEYPVDNIGIQPDIYLDRYVDDWIRFAVNYLEGADS
ncbi:S41 family peptidase [Salinivirga cyanobacteriivorans]